MNAKKVLGFMLCRSAFSQRNVTSVFLVGVFFCVYVMAGGKITTKLPAPSELSGLVKRDGLGNNPAAIRSNNDISSLTAGDSKSVLGVIPSSDRRGREQSLAKRGRLFPEEERIEAEDEPIDSEGLVKGANFTTRRELIRLQKSEKKQVDSLSAIEERLKMRRQ